MTNKTGTPSPNSLAGWFVDNIMVEGAPCELEPPTLDWVGINPQAKPEGARYMPTQDVRVEGKDNIGVDSMRIYIRRYDYSASSWTAWTDSLMSSTVTTSCPDSSIYEYTFGNIDVNDTVEWYVRIFDCACPNVVRAPLESAPNFAYKVLERSSTPSYLWDNYSELLPVFYDPSNGRGLRKPIVLGSGYRFRC